MNASLLFHFIFFTFLAANVTAMDEESTTVVDGLVTSSETTSVAEESTEESTEASSAGECATSPCPASVRARPVCASDRKVYDSQCSMNAASNCSLTMLEWEECRGVHPLCPADCLDIQDPVCGEDGRIYPNKCVMHQRNCGRHINHKPILFCMGSNRKSRNENKCAETCQELYRPVCGSDGEIYLNECYMRKQNCRRKVSRVEMSECVSLSNPCPSSCIPIYDPVCGSDHRLYINQCSMLRDNCKTPVKSMPIQFCVGDRTHHL